MASHLSSASLPTDAPQPLLAPEPARIQAALAEFWAQLAELSELLAAHELLLSAERAADLRGLVLEMMLALNGIQRPASAGSLNRYLSPRQRAALEKTLAAPQPGREAWIGQAVALVVIFRWYAPQLVEKFNLDYPADLEQEVWERIARALPDWPLAVTTD